MHFGFLSANNGTGNTGDWSIIYRNRVDFDFRVDSDHNYDGSIACIPNIAYTTRAWKSKVCDLKWHQIMACHLASNNTIYGFVDGNLEGTAVADFNVTGTTVDIGGTSAERNYFVDGYLDDMVLIKDNCMHTESFKLDSSYITDILNSKYGWLESSTRKLYGYK